MKQRVLVRFANESTYYSAIDLDVTKLTNVMKFHNEVFATVDDIRIAIKREDYEKLLQESLDN